MGIRFLCPNGHKLNVKADLAGKRASCPECGVKLTIPASTIPAAGAGSVVAPAVAIVVNQPPLQSTAWYLRTRAGEQLGPATDDLFCTWIAAGRVTADAHVWRDGWAEWKLARDAAEALPMPLAAVSVAAPPPNAAAPVVAAPAPPQPIMSIPEPDPILEPDLDPLAAEPVVSEAIVTDPTALAASTYAFERRRSKKSQLTLAVVMLVAVIVLAVVLVWVVRSNTSAAPQTSRANQPSFFNASATNG
jgi:hypothetical protein